MPKATATPDPKDKDSKKDKPQDGGWRETVESIAMAIILALLFRGFVAEAFVIPTGSMAPTLMGRHKDVKCPECGQWYKTGASNERTSDGGLTGQFVTTTTCSVCRYTQRLDLFDKPGDLSYSGDRIIVSKFAYEIGEPERWDVIVFKFPGEATINYIKRLIGLPGETVLIGGGNIYTKKGEDQDFRIARKPPGRLNSMLQLVDDTDHIPPRLTKLGWPTRWQQWPAAGAGPAWTTEDGGKSYAIDAKDADVWLRYRHIVPSHQDWQEMIAGKLPEDAQSRRGSLIIDFSAYNAPGNIDQDDIDPDRGGRQMSANLIRGKFPLKEYDLTLPGPGEPPARESFGQHWADDLAVDCTVQLESAAGELTLDLVQAGVHHRCQINLADGTATLHMTDPTGEVVPFDAPEAKSGTPTAHTNVRGAGTYRLRLSNIDRQVLLWVNGSVVPFDLPTTYECNRNLTPFWTASDPLDLAPAGIAAKGCKVQVSSLKIHRDIYYIAADHDSNAQDDYTQSPILNEISGNNTINQLFSQPELWEKNTAFFTTRRDATFKLDQDQFFPMGDNSSHSSDARIWSGPGGRRIEDYVDRDLMIGRAMCVYWPHTWNTPIPFTPNPGQMRRIR